MTKQKYAITEKKQAELNALATQITDTTNLVSQLESMVDSLSQKSANFAGQLATALVDKDTALTNYDLLKNIVNSVKNLVSNAEIVSDQTQKSKDSLQIVSGHVSDLIGELIFSAEMINKLQVLVNNRKVLVPLISDQLIDILTTACADANNAVALTLTALQSCYAAQASGKEANEITILEYSQSQALYEHLTGKDLSLYKESYFTLMATNEISTVESSLTIIKEAESALNAAIATSHNDESDAAKSNKSAEKDIAKLQSSVEKKLNDEQLSQEKLMQAEQELTSFQNQPSPTSEEDKKASQSKLDELDSAVTKAKAELDKCSADFTASNKELIEARQTRDAALTEQAKTRRANQKAVDSAQLDLYSAVNQLDSDILKLNNITSDQGDTSLQFLMAHAYQQSVMHYKIALKANNAVTKELDVANAKLAVARNKLASLSAGFAAANAAALAA